MLTVAILTKNEEGSLKVCLESVKWADEIIIMDDHSTDKTVDIAGKYTDKIFTVDGGDFAKIRNLAIEKAKGDWVLFVDADERVTQELKNELMLLIQKEDFSAYAISRKNIIFGKLEKYGPYWPDWVVRLIRKRDFNEYVGKIHEFPRFKGELGYTQSSFIHLTHRNLDQIVLKSLSWSNIDSKLRFESGHPKMSGWRFLRILISELINQGVLRKGFFNGAVGTMDSLLQTFSLIMSYIRLWELQQPKKISDVYKDIDKKLLEEDFNPKI